MKDGLPAAICFTAIVGSSRKSLDLGSVMCCCSHLEDEEWMLDVRRAMFCFDLKSVTWSLFWLKCYSTQFSNRFNNTLGKYYIYSTIYPERKIFFCMIIIKLLLAWKKHKLTQINFPRELLNLKSCQFYQTITDKGWFTTEEVERIQNLTLYSYCCKLKYIWTEHILSLELKFAKYLILRVASVQSDWYQTNHKIRRHHEKMHIFGQSHFSFESAPA